MPKKIIFNIYRKKKIMGNLAAMDMVIQNGVNEQTLRWQLQSNHYPPLPEVCIKLAKRVIKKANAGDFYSNISLRGTGISWRGKHLVPVNECIDAWHLEFFINQGE